MRARVSVAVMLASLMLGIAATARAQVAQTFDELAAAGTLQPGERIELRGPAGQEARGVFGGFKGSELVLLVGKDRAPSRFTEADVQRIRRAGGHAVGFGAAIGAAGAFAVTAWAASRYGDNEGGSFCSGCLAQWGAIAVPAGAGIGAAIGLAIEQARRTTLLTAPRPRPTVDLIPMVSRSGAGIVLSARF
jgi:hypothetical protein